MSRYDTPPYYITAYGLAVKHGFKGTEEEWLKSLKASEIEIRYLDGMLQWRRAPNTTDESGTSNIKTDDGETEGEAEDLYTWHDLIDIADIRGEVIEQAMAETIAAAEYAKSEADKAAGAKKIAETANQTADYAKQAADIALGTAEENSQILGSYDQRIADAERDATDARTVAESAATNAEQAKTVADSAKQIAESVAQRCDDFQQDATDAIERLNTEKLPQPSEPVQVGDYLQVAAVSEDGKKILKLIPAAAPAGGTDGVDGITPHIGTNGNWWIGTTDTGVKAEGTVGNDGVGIKSISRTAGTGAAGTTDTYTITYTDGNTSTYTVYNGKDGSNGVTPHIGDNGNWWLGDTDTEAYAGEKVPAYVVTAAEAVIDKVIAAQGNRTFTFAALADLHYGVWSYTDGIRHACQALRYIDSHIKLDALAVLGDYTDGYPDEEYDNAIADFKAVNKELDGLRFISNMRLSGNHDFYSVNPALTLRYINAYSDDVVWGSRTGGYYYRDFDAYKLRIIGVNTSENAGGLDVSTEQYNWFVSALDLTDKDDDAEWSILILSHHPLDWYPTDDTYRFCYILDGYRNGTSGTTGGIAYDFTGGKNAAMLIGNVHGHIHNFKVDYIHFGNVNGNSKSGVLRMAAPNACYNRENEYGEPWAEETAYPKTKNTAEDTAFVIYCIDLDTYTIKAICYGAGYDREAIYYEKSAEVVNLVDTVGYTDGGRISTSSGSVGTKEGYVCTGLITLEAEGDVYRTSGVNFNADVEYDRGICVYTNDGAYKSYESAYLKNSPITMGHSMGTLEVDADGNLIYTVGSGWNYEGSPRKIRFCGYGTGGNLIITKNQEII